MDGAGAGVCWLQLTNFRNYEHARLEVDGPVAVLHGPNGAGKTNLLEALSLLSPGRGLRQAKLRDVSRQDGPGGWAIAARLDTPDGLVNAGTGLEVVNDDGAGKRSSRIDGTDATSAALGDLVGVQWLTPRMDRLFMEGASARRRFLDRLVYGFDREHSRRVTAYERGMRERNVLLSQGEGDAAWLAALEERMAADGVAVAAARQDAVERLSIALGESVGLFPGAVLQVEGDLEAGLLLEPAVEIEGRFRDTLMQNRRRDREAGHARMGPHRSDLLVQHAQKRQPAAQCSTGEQKALLIAIQLANARLETARRGCGPILLLDEVAAHLDSVRRNALFEEIEALSGQVWLTGTDREVFRPLDGRGQFFRIAEAKVVTEE
jgi:DNA replication and repair protein RecF